MTPQRFHHDRPGPAFPLAVGLLVVASLLPSGWLSWLQSLSALVIVPTGPISAVAYRLTRSAIPAEAVENVERVRILEEERQGFETLYLKERAENQRLRDLIRELQGGLALNPQLAVRQMPASVIGASSDLSSGILKVRVGSSGLVDANTVATTTGLQLVGRVVSTAGPICNVQPFTRKAAGKIQVRIVTGGPDLPLMANLTPTGDGTLRGEVGVIRPLLGADAPTPEVAQGMIVRLDDPQWPDNARMLVVGRVESVEASEDQPLRKVIVVRPTVDVARVTEVLLRLPPAEPAQEAGGTP